MSSHDISSLEQLRSLYREPSERVRTKKGTRIDGATAQFLADSTFLCLATANADGTCDVSPRGGPAGQLKPLGDGTSVALPDLGGNNLIDSLTNIVANGHAGLLVMVPGSDETLRVDGRARLTTDPGILNLWSTELRTPKVAVVLEIDALFMHCAKAFRRGGVWQPDTWPAMDDTAACRMFNDISGADMEPSEMRHDLEANYEESLASEKADSI
ncbi:MAG: MSMEG_1061 family FMN-dependent PPOX-type flavoprotein [Acidimicrobiales bacterium]